MSGPRDQHETDIHGRTEPTLGNLDQLDTSPPPVLDNGREFNIEPRARHAGVRPLEHTARRGWLLPILLLLLIGFMAAVWINQNRLRAMLPRTELNDVLGRAQQALQAGHLDGQDGSSARELFEAAMALEPDNDRARDGLRQVGLAELSQADAALQAGRMAQATRQAAVARELLGGGSDVDRLDQAISRAGAASVPAVDLVAQAQQALAAGQLDGAQGAGALYQRVLRADPGNAVAQHGLNQVGDALAMQARKALDANDAVAADASLAALAALQPNHGALPALRAARAQLLKQDNGALNHAITQGQAALRAGRIVGDSNDTALAYFKTALAMDPDNAQAKAGLGDVAQALTVQANAAIDAGNLPQARQLLDNALELAPKSADIAAARARIAAAQPLTAPAPTAPPAAALPVASVTITAQQRAAIDQLLQRARLATSNGNIMLPPGDCAYDLYRSALAIDGNNTAALAGLQGLPAKVEQQFNQALGAGKLHQASAMLANLAELSPGDAAQASLSARLASAWLDQAEQQLGSGDRVGASQSLEQARKLAPNHPRVADLAARLQSGQ